MISKSVAPLILAWMLTTAQAPAQRQSIENASQLPPVTIGLPRKPSELAVAGAAEFRAVSGKIETYAQNVIRNYEIRDRTAERQMRSLLRDVALVEDRWPDALRLSEQIRALEDKPSSRAISGLVEDAYARAAIRVGEADPQFRGAFEEELRQAVAALDWSVAQSSLRTLGGNYYLMVRNLLLGDLQNLDLNAAAQKMAVNVGVASNLVRSRLVLSDYLPLAETVSRVVAERVQAEAAATPDRWTPRLAALDQADVKQPVVIAIWDTGLDPEVFRGRLWVNSRETANGRDDDGNGFADDLHGPAFDENRARSTGMLRPMPAEDLSDYPRLSRLLKGVGDAGVGVISPEAAELRKTLSSLDPKSAPAFWTQIGRLTEYTHGTAVGAIAADGNPGARLMMSRFSRRQQAVPQPVDEQFAEATARYARDAIGYFRQNGARVVNMSFRLSEPLVTASLASVEPDPKRRSDRGRRIFDTMSNAFEEAMRDAPDILFVAAAGNEDENVDFIRSFPAGINLPNLITVGAINPALEPTEFTSYGKSVDVYANGFQVRSVAPGGLPDVASGTSIAAPFVTNLAAKMLAVNPSLTAADLRSLIEQTATSEGERGLKVIHPTAALLRARALIRQAQASRAPRHVAVHGA